MPALLKCASQNAAVNEEVIETEATAKRWVSKPEEKANRNESREDTERDKQYLMTDFSSKLCHEGPLWHILASINAFPYFVIAEERWHLIRWFTFFPLIPILKFWYYSIDKTQHVQKGSYTCELRLSSAWCLLSKSRDIWLVCLPQRVRIEIECRQIPDFLFFESLFVLANKFHSVCRFMEYCFSFSPLTIVLAKSNKGRTESVVFCHKCSTIRRLCDRNIIALSLQC